MIDNFKKQAYNIFPVFLSNCKKYADDPFQMIETDNALAHLIAKFEYVQLGTALNYLKEFEACIYFTNNEFYLDPKAPYTNQDEELSVLIKMLFLFFLNRTIQDDGDPEVPGTLTTITHYLEIDPKKSSILKMKLKPCNLPWRSDVDTANLPAFKWHIPYFFIPIFISCLLATIDKNVKTCHQFFKEVEDRFSAIIKTFYTTDAPLAEIKRDFSIWMDTFLARRYFLTIEDFIDTYALTGENKGILRKYFWKYHQNILYSPEPLIFRLGHLQVMLKDFTDCIERHFSTDGLSQSEKPQKIPIKYLYPNEWPWILNGEKEFLNNHLAFIQSNVKEFIAFIKAHNKQHVKPDCPYKLAVDDFERFNEQYSTRLEGLKQYQVNLKSSFEDLFKQAMSNPSIQSALENGQIRTVDINARIKAFLTPIRDKFLNSAIKEFDKFLKNTKRASYPTEQNTRKLYTTSDYMGDLENKISILSGRLQEDMEQQWQKQPNFFIFYDLGILERIMNTPIGNRLTELNKLIEVYKKTINSQQI